MDADALVHLAGYGNTFYFFERKLDMEIHGRKSTDHRSPVRSLEIRWTLGRGLNSASIRSWWVEQIVSTFVG